MMLRNSDRNRSDLLKQLEENEKQLQRYETKLKDVVRAYKSLNAEKEALQATVVALTGEDSSKDSAGETTDIGEKPLAEENLDDAKYSAEERVILLKKSLATLIAEKSRRETAYQSDKKALLAENDSLRERLQKAADETEAQAEELERRMMNMSAKLKRIEEDRERELSDHGSVFAEMQQRYAKERANATQLGKQIAELYKKLHEKEEVSSHGAEKIAELVSELKKAREEGETWRKKAEKSPTMQMLENELQNFKAESQREIAELRSRLSLQMNEERESRLHELEERLRVMAEEMGDIERIRAEGENKIEKLQKLNEKLEMENRNLSLAVRKGNGNVSLDDPEDIKGKIVSLINKLRTNDEDINLYDLFGLEKPLREEKLRYEQLQDEFEKYKLKAHAVLKSRDIPLDYLGNSVALSRVSPLPTVTECASCANAEADLRYTRSVIASLHEKLQTLEIDHASAKREYDEKCAELHQTINAMRSSHENLTMELRQQMQERIVEMEVEMQKQRNRTLEILAEKEEELEMIKTVLISVKSQKLIQNDPMDPPQGNTVVKQHGKIRKSHSRELPERALSIEERRSDNSRLSSATEQKLSGTESYSSIIDELHIDHSVSQIPAISSTTEAKNFFYEQELAKRDKLITELRNSLHITESNARDLQQAALTKDLLHLEIVEKLKDEINNLEGKLKFYSGNANMEYLRNIFIQLLHCESSSGRKHILRAIGTVLKLSSNEMRNIDKH